MNRQQLIALSSELDQVIEFGIFDRIKGFPSAVAGKVRSRMATDPELKASVKGLKRVFSPMARPAGLGAAGGSAVGGIGGAMSDDPEQSALGGALKGAAAGGALGIAVGAGASGYKNNLALNRLDRLKRAKMARTQYVPPAGGAMGMPPLSAKYEKLVNLSAELDDVINFDLSGILSAGKKLLTPSVGAAALKWGGLGAAGGALAGGVSGAMSDDPNASLLGGAFKGAATGGALGALGGAGMRGYKMYGKFNGIAAAKTARLAGVAGSAEKAVAGNVVSSAPMAAAPVASATAAADQMAAKAVAPGKTGYEQFPDYSNASFVQPRHVSDPMGYGIGGNTINPMPSRIGGARTTSVLRDPNTSVADALTNKRKSIYEAGMNTPRGMKSPTVFSARHQSLVQISAELSNILRA